MKETFSRTGLRGFLVVALAAALLGCTTTDPYTGQQKIDYGATAGVAGLALGATALGVAISNRNDRQRDVVVIDRRPGYGGGAYRPYRPYANRPYAYGRVPPRHRHRHKRWR